MRYCDGEIPAPGPFSEADEAIRATERRSTDAASHAIDRLAIHEAIGAVWELVDELNGYITVQEPWSLAKDPANRERLQTVLYTAVRGLGTLAVLLSPVVPEATAKLWSALGGNGEITGQRIDRAWEWAGGTHVSPLEALFPRIEATVG
jgi:methionyl-tRNA synthetase